MRTQSIPLVGDSYADETRPWSQQDTVNYLPCAAEVEGTLSGAMLKTPPGLKPFLEIADAPPVRRTHNAEGKLFAVIGRELYRITNDQVAIPVGEVPGIGRVVMAHNQISLGNEIIAVNGQAGYVYNTVTDTFGRITDPGYPGSATAVFIDGYLVQIEPQGRYAFNSEPAQATQYNTLDRFTSEVSPDRLVAPAVFNNKLLLLSKTTSEFFENSGAAQQPFRSTRITMDKGCAGPYAIAHADNTVFFLGSDGMFYMVDGYRPVRISKRPLEQAIRGLNWSQVFAEVWEDAGFTVIYWTFPDGRTWGFNAADRRWHRRESLGLNRWRVNSMTRWNNTWIAGDFQRGRLWEVSWDYLGLEGDQEYISERTLAVIHDDQNLVLIPRVEVVMDTGQPETVPIPFPEQPEGPTITGDAPDGILGLTYAEFPYTITGGTPPYVVTQRPTSTIAAAGLTMNTAGVIAETVPEVLGEFLSVPRVTDAKGLWDEIEDPITITLGPSLALGVEVELNNNRLSSTVSGIEWSPIITPAPAMNLSHLAAATGGRFIAFPTSNTNSRYTDDYGATWTIASLAYTPAVCVGYCYFDDVVMIPGGEGVNRSTDRGESYVGVDLSESLIAVQGNADLVVAMDSISRVAFSTDEGLTFSAFGPRLDTTLNPLLSFINCSAEGNDRIMFGGSSVSGNVPVIAYTNDGSDFTSVALPGDGTEAVRALCWGNVGGDDGTWVAAYNNGKFYYSHDNGDTWTLAADELDIEVTVGMSIVFTGVLFIAGGGGDGSTNIATSPDGNIWTIRDQPLAYSIDSIALSRGA